MKTLVLSLFALCLTLTLASGVSTTVQADPGIDADMLYSLVLDTDSGSDGPQRIDHEIKDCPQWVACVKNCLYGGTLMQICIQQCQPVWDACQAS